MHTPSLARRLCQAPCDGEHGRKAPCSPYTLAIAGRAAEVSCKGGSTARLLYVCSAGVGGHLLMEEAPAHSSHACHRGESCEGISLAWYLCWFPLAFWDTMWSQTSCMWLTGTRFSSLVYDITIRNGHSDKINNQNTNDPLSSLPLRLQIQGLLNQRRSFKSLRI